MTTLNDLKNTRRTKRYADGHQKLLETHIFEPDRPAPQPSELARRRKAGKPRRADSHRARRAVKLAQRLEREGWKRTKLVRGR